MNLLFCEYWVGLLFDKTLSVVCVQQGKSGSPCCEYWVGMLFDKTLSVVCVSSRARVVTYRQEQQSTSASLIRPSLTSTCVVTLAFRFIAYCFIDCFSVFYVFHRWGLYHLLAQCTFLTYQFLIGLVLHALIVLKLLLANQYLCVLV